MSYSDAVWLQQRSCLPRGVVRRNRHRGRFCVDGSRFLYVTPFHDWSTRVHRPDEYSWQQVRTPYISPRFKRTSFKHVLCDVDWRRETRTTGISSSSELSTSSSQSLGFRWCTERCLTHHCTCASWLTWRTASTRVSSVKSENNYTVFHAWAQCLYL